MPTTYSIADPDVTDLLARVMARYHPRLNDAGVKVGVLFAHNSDGPAIKKGGYEVLACVKSVSLKDRLTKGYDAELLIDGGDYERLREGQRAALCDHVLSQLDTIDRGEDDEGDGDLVSWKTDDIGRPKLRAVPGNWHAGVGFNAVIARHGSDAIEYENLSRCKAHADAARRQAERDGA